MLHAFLTWAESSSEDEAAHKLGITQPAVHRKLERFQTQIGTGPRLMQRSRGGWELTVEGRTILPVIRDLVRRFEQLESHLGHRDEPVRCLRIATGQFATHYILPRVIAQLRQKLTDCRVETHLARGTERIIGVADACFDLAIVSHHADQVNAIVRKHFRTAGSLLTCVPLVRYPFAVIAHCETAEGHILADLQPADAVTVLELCRLSLVGLDPQSGIRQRLERMSGGISLRFNTDTRAGGWPAALAYATQGLGAAFIPRVVLPNRISPKLVVRPFDQTFTLEQMLIVRAGFRDSAVELAESIFREVVSSLLIELTDID
jgi:DNA-binding transcriptional LysR family regulator